MEKTAFIHIGMPKTGSTGLQETLSTNREQLKAQGIMYPGNGRTHTALCAEYHPKKFDCQAFKNRTQADVEADLKKIIDDISVCESDVILSSEFFSELRPHGIQALSKRLSKIGFNSVFVCFVRHPVNAAVSSSQQAIKMGAKTLQDVISAPPYVSEKARLTRFVEAVGKDRIILTDFVDAQKEGVTKLFFGRINRPRAINGIEEIRSNEGLSMDGAILADFYTSHVRKRGFVPFPKRLIWKVGSDKFNLPEATLNKVREETQADVDWVAVEFGTRLVEKVIKSAFRDKLSTSALVKSTYASIAFKMKRLKNRIFGNPARPKSK